MSFHWDCCVYIPRKFKCSFIWLLRLYLAQNKLFSHLTISFGFRTTLAVLSFHHYLNFLLFCLFRLYLVQIQLVFHFDCFVCILRKFNCSFIWLFCLYLAQLKCLFLSSRSSLAQIKLFFHLNFLFLFCAN